MGGSVDIYTVIGSQLNRDQLYITFTLLILITLYPSIHLGISLTQQRNEVFRGCLCLGGTRMVSDYYIHL